MTHTALLTLLVAGCSCGATTEVDAGAPDVPAEDAGPWRPAFAPRIIYSNPDVTCAPVDLTYAPPDRTPVAPGTVLWVYRPLEDPAALTGLGSVDADPFQFAPWPIFGTTDGGLVVNVDGHRNTLMAIRPDGTLRTVIRGNRSPVRLTYAPAAAAGIPDEPTDIMVGLGNAPALASTANSLPTDQSEETFVIERLPGRVRTHYVDPLSGLTSQPDPVLLEDGTIIWSPTSSTLFASCIHGGRTRWILEYDATAFAGPSALMGDEAGGFFLFAHQLYRISGDGEVVAEREPPSAHENWTPTTYSPRCGVAGEAYDVAIVDGRREGINSRVVYLSGPALETERVLPFAGLTTADCGVLRPWSRSGAGGFDVRLDLRRYSAAGEELWSYPTASAMPSSVSIAELADGSVLIIWEDDGVRAPALTLIDPTGVPLELPLDPDVVGAQLTHGAHYITPDGVLYLASQGDFLNNPLIVAIELGVGPAMPYPDGNGLDWARTNAAWLSTE